MIEKGVEHKMDLKRQCKLVAELFDMSIFFVSSTGEVQFELMGNRILNPLYKNDKQFFFQCWGLIHPWVKKILQL